MFQVQHLQQQLIRKSLDLTSGPGLAAAMERIADTPFPQPLMAGMIRAFAKAFSVNLDDAADPVESFPTLNAFFTRRLRNGLRPVDSDPTALVSPADGHLSFWGRLDEGGHLPATATVKGQTWSAADLVGRPCPELHHGHVAIVYLSPRDYHRVHTPVSGRVEAVTAIPGARYPVNGLGLGSVPSLFTRNLRTVFTLNSNDHGHVQVVMVGATNVGRITTAVVAGQDIKAGDELGTFNLGSTVVILRPVSDSAEIATFRGDPTAGSGVPVQVGEALARRNP